MSKTFIKHYNIEPWTAKELWKCAPSDGQGDFTGEGKKKTKVKNNIIFDWLFVSDSAVELMIKRMAASDEP